jgi:hypothetical protein
MHTTNKRLLIITWVGALILTIFQLEAMGNPDIIFDDSPALVEEVQIYPNPVTDNKIFVRSAIDIRSVDIYNILGKLILSNKELSGNKKKTEINLNDISDGVYLLKVTLTNGQRFTEKILLEK